jgi:hypothetical protein
MDRLEVLVLSKLVKDYVLAHLVLFSLVEDLLQEHLLILVATLG